MAGVTAVADQGDAYLFNGYQSFSGGDFLNALYHLPQDDINDIVTGNNGTAAGPGYDLVTGRGTPIVDRFVSSMIGAPIYNPLTGELLVTGGASGSSDTITLSESGGQIDVQVSTSIPVPGTGNPASETFTYNPGQLSSITVSTGNGNTTVNVLSSTNVTVNLVNHGDTTVNVGAGNNTLNVREIDGGTSTVLNLGTGDTVNVRGTSAGLTVNCGGGDVINVGAGDLHYIGGHVTVNGSGSDYVNVNDQATALSDTYDITSSTLSRIVFGGLTYSGLARLTLNAGTGDNTISIHSTSAPVTINDDAGSDVVNVGDPGLFLGLNNLPGGVTVNGGGSDYVNVEDQAAAFSQLTYDITSSTLSRFDFGGLTYSGLAGLTLNAETGDDTINIHSTSAPVAINAAAGSDVVNVGDPNLIFGLANLPGAVTVNGGGSDHVNVNDQAGGFSGTYDITSSTLSRSSFGGLKYSDIAGLTLYAETNNNTLNVHSTSAPVTLYAAGSDVVNVGDPNLIFGLANLPGGVTINGGGSDHVNVNDQAGGFSGTYDITSSTLSRSSFGGLKYSDIAGLTLYAETNNNTLNVHSTSAPVTLDAAGSDVVNVGDPNLIFGLANLPGAVTVNGGGSDHVNVNDQAGGFSGTYDITSSTLSRSSFGGLKYSDIAGLTLYVETNNNTINVHSTSAPVTIDDTGSDVVNVGDPNLIFGLTNLPGGVTVHGGGSDHVNVNDQFGAFSQGSYDITSSTLSRIDFGGLTYSGLAGLTLYAQKSSNTINVVSTSPSTPVTINGDGGTDTLVGPNTTNTWNITGAGSGSLGVVSFKGVANLTGGSGTDTFKFASGGSVSGKINGGAGTNTLNYSGDGGVAVTVNLATDTASETGGFANIQTLVGSGAAGDKLIGPNATNIWSITAANAGTVGSFSFSGVKNLTGGTGVDEFVFSAGATVSGKIDGGTTNGNDWLDYAAYTTATTVNLATNSATGIDGGVAGGIANIRNVRGGQGGNTLTGNSLGNILIGGVGNNTINGGSGRSILIADKGTSTINGGSADDIVIGGYTTYDGSGNANDQALMAIMAEWQSSDSYSTRVSKITAGVAGGAKLVLGTTVFSNGKSNTLNGGGGSNWILS